jgi:ribokinase
MVTVVGSYILALVMDVPRIPLEGETLVGHNYHTTHGGKGSNMAVCAARLGADTRFFGKVGRDTFGDAFRALLDQEGVKADTLLVADKSPTAVGFIIFSARGSNVIVIDMAANIKANESAVRTAEVSLSPLEIPLETVLAAARIARAAGRRFILNPAPAQDLRGVDLSDVFAITPNEREARVCLGLQPDDPRSDEEIAANLLKLGVPNVMLTRGENGVLWMSAEGICHVPALPVTVVDTVGAGDAFNAGLAVGLSEGLPILDAVALGVTAASLSTQRRETLASYRTRAEVEEHFQRTRSGVRSLETI